jgi:hypothetical protein
MRLSDVATLQDRSRALYRTWAHSDDSDLEIGPQLYRLARQFAPFVVRFLDRAIHGQLGMMAEYRSLQVPKMTRRIHHPRFALKKRTKSQLLRLSFAAVRR